MVPENRGMLTVVASRVQWGAMAFICVMCDKPESDCLCEKYCMLCKSDEGLRLCADGCYYCEPCREACDFQPEN